MLKKTILFLLASSLGTLYASSDKPESIANETPVINNAFWHADLGLGPLPILLPSFSVGYRNQWTHHGTDFYLSASTIVYVTEAKLNALYHYYFNPSLKSQFYIGAGAGVGAVFQKDKSFDKTILCLSPEFVFGKEYESDAGGRRFLQMQLSFPTIATSHLHKNTFTVHQMMYYPLVIVSYGIGF